MDSSDATRMRNSCVSLKFFWESLTNAPLGGQVPERRLQQQRDLWVGPLGPTWKGYFLRALAPEETLLTPLHPRTNSPAQDRNRISATTADNAPAAAMSASNHAARQ